MASISEDRVALVVGRLTLQVLSLEQERDELLGMYRQAVADLYPNGKKEAEANGVSPEGSGHQGT